MASKDWIGLLMLAALPLAGMASQGEDLEPQRPKASRPSAIPTVWDDTSIVSLEVPLPTPGASPVHITAEQYYKIPAPPIYQSYPIYHPGREPKGYQEWLKRLEGQESRWHLRRMEA